MDTVSMDTDTRTALDHAVATLEQTKHELEAAKTELEQVLSEIRVAPRAEKTAVSTAIEGALRRLRNAHTKVNDAEKTLAKQRTEQDP